MVSAVITSLCDCMWWLLGTVWNTRW